MIKGFQLASAILVISAFFLSCTSNPTEKVKSQDPISLKEDSISSNPVDNNVDSNGTLKEVTNQDWLLIPGKSAGKTVLNADAEQVYKRLGKPDGGDAAMGKSVTLWYSDHDSTLHSVAIYTVRDMGNDPKALVTQIRVTAPLFKTKEGIHTTSSLGEIQKVFNVQKKEEYEDSGKMFIVYESKSGISFEMDANKKCVAIIIHKSGQARNGTYLKFRTTNKFISR